MGKSIAILVSLLLLSVSAVSAQITLPSMPLQQGVQITQPVKTTCATAGQRPAAGLSCCENLILSDAGQCLFPCAREGEQLAMRGFESVQFCCEGLDTRFSEGKWICRPCTQAGRTPTTERPCCGSLRTGRDGTCRLPTFRERLGVPEPTCAGPGVAPSRDFPCCEGLAEVRGKCMATVEVRPSPGAQDQIDRMRRLLAELNTLLNDLDRRC